MSAPAQDDGPLREAAAVLSAVLGEAAPPEVDLFALLRKHGSDAALAADRFFAQQEEEEQRAAPEPEPPPRAPPTSAALHVRAVVNGGVRRGPSANGRAACSLTAHGAPTAESLGSQLKGTNAWPKPFGCLFVKAFSLVKQSANELVLLEGDPLEPILPAPTAAKSHIKGKPHKISIDETIRLCRQRNLSGGDGVGGSAGGGGFGAAPGGCGGSVGGSGGGGGHGRSHSLSCSRSHDCSSSHSHSSSRERGRGSGSSRSEAHGRGRKQADEESGAKHGWWVGSGDDAP